MKYLTLGETKSALSWCTPVKFSTARGDFFAIEAGEGPVVLFLHGVTANAFVFAPILDALRSEYHVIAIDQRGHGRTGVLGSDPRTDSTWDAESYALDIEAIIAAIGQPVVIVGHSLGSRNALVAAARGVPGLLGVIGIDFTPFIEPTVFDLLSERVVAGSAPRSDRRDVVEHLAARYPNLPVNAVERRADFGYIQEGDSWRTLADPEAMAAICRGLREDLTSSLETCAIPLLLVRGAESLLVTVEAWRKTKELRADLPMVTVPGADHYVPEEDPHAIASIVRTFFDTYLPTSLSCHHHRVEADSGEVQSKEELMPSGEDKKPAQPIEWSVAVEVKTSDKGKITVKVPPQVAETFKIGDGDVLCWTGFADGTVEVWAVPKSPYSTLYTEEKS